MGLVVLTGGVRSGKSRLAVELATGKSRSPVFIATAQARDEEMAERIARHRAERSGEWTTLEEPVELHEALEAVPAGEVAVVDCLTLWVSNLLEREHPDDSIVDLARSAADLASSRTGDVFAVTNEVGSGVIPDNPLGRRFADVLGKVNTVWSDTAERVLLVVAGRVLLLSRPEAFLDG